MELDVEESSAVVFFVLVLNEHKFIRLCKKVVIIMSECNGFGFIIYRKEHYTALHIAAKEGQEEVKRFLKRKISDSVIVNYVLGRISHREECGEILR